MQAPKTFNKAPPPGGYVAGVGRGAMGFTTRSDIGSAASRTSTEPPEVKFGQAPQGYVAGRGYSGFGTAGMSAEPQLGGGGRGRPPVGQERPAPSADYSESMWDANMGYGGERLFARDAYEEDDAEADRIYDSIDARMEGRQKASKRQREEEMLANPSAAAAGSAPKQVKITERFADLKRDLASVTAEQWEGIPEVGDHSLKFKQKRDKESYVPLPDHLIASSLSGAGVTNGNTAGYSTSIDSQQFSQKLDRMSDSVSGQTVVDPKGYLTDLNSVRVNSAAEVGDIKKARLLLHSVTSTNPKHAPGWIAAALVEEVAGKMVAARKVIMQGCETCPESEDLWLEAARLHTAENARSILAQAVKHVRTSVKLWLKAAELESSDAQRRVVLRRALEFVPSSVILWKTAIQLESVGDAKIMLARAVECVPQCVDMWLALARLETHENAQRVLNEARKALPTEPACYIAGAKLEEAHGNLGKVPDIIKLMLWQLAQFQVATDRYSWIREAQAAEAAGAVHTSAAIVQQTLHQGVDEEDRPSTWLDDAESCASAQPPAVETARAIYRHALAQYPTRKTLWLAWAMFERKHGTPSTLEATLQAAVQRCPQEEVLWLLAAKEKWVAGSVADARAILKMAFDANPGSQQIWLAAAKLEWENDEFARARALLAKAREHASSDKVWLKAALLERETGHLEEELALLEEGMRRYPSCWKLYLMAGQAMEATQPARTAEARAYYQRGLKVCGECVPLWLHTVWLEERERGPNKARTVVELARLKLPTADLLWLEAVRLERRAGNDKLAESVMAKALQACATSGVLWAEDVMTCPKPAQRSKSVDALKRCDNDPYVITAVARLFDRDRKLDKARKWFERAVGIDSRNGDSWAHFYVFELLHRAPADAADASEAVLRRCVAAEPNRGEVWCRTAKRTALRRTGVANILRTIAAEILAGPGTVAATAPIAATSAATAERDAAPAAAAAPAAETADATINEMQLG